MSSMRSSAKTVLADESLWDETPAQRARLLASLGYTATEVADELELDEQGDAFEAWLDSLPLGARREAERDIPTAFTEWALRSQPRAS